MSTIIGRQYTPQKEDGNRDVIHPETQIDAVLDPIKGKPLRDQLTEITDTLVPVGPDSEKPGLLSPQTYNDIKRAAESLIITDTIKPVTSTGCYWFNIYDQSMTTVDKE